MTPDWTAFLTERGATLDERGISFPAAGAANTDAILVPLTHLSLIRSAGEDSAPFLHNLFSNDVKKLVPGTAQWNSFNSPKGRMLASFLLWGTPTDHWLAVSSDLREALQKKLSMYVLRSKVKLDHPADVELLGLAGARAATLLEAAGAQCPDADMRQAAFDGGTLIRINAGTFILALPQSAAGRGFDALIAAGAQAAGTAAWQLAMIRAGVPLITSATQEEFVAQMLNYELIGGVSFNKGCYPGQEIVARTQYLGKLKKRMYRVGIDGAEAPAPGADLYTPEFGEQSAGKLVNVAPSPDGGFEALAVMQTSCAAAGDARVGAPDGPRVRFLELPYALP